MRFREPCITDLAAAQDKIPYLGWSPKGDALAIVRQEICPVPGPQDLEHRLQPSGCPRWQAP